MKLCKRNYSFYVTTCGHLVNICSRRYIYLFNLYFFSTTSFTQTLLLLSSCTPATHLVSRKDWHVRRSLGGRVGTEEFLAVREIEKTVERQEKELNLAAAEKVCEYEWCSDWVEKSIAAWGGCRCGGGLGKWNSRTWMGKLARKGYWSVKTGHETVVLRKG